MVELQNSCSASCEFLPHPILCQESCANEIGNSPWFLPSLQKLTISEVHPTVVLSTTGSLAISGSYLVGVLRTFLFACVILLCWLAESSQNRRAAGGWSRQSLDAGTSCNNGDGHAFMAGDWLSIIFGSNHDRCSSLV